MKRQGDELRRARDYAEAIVQAVRQPLVVLNGELTVTTVNPAFRKTFGLGSAPLVGRRLNDLADGVWEIPELNAALTEVLHSRRDGESIAVEHGFPGVGAKRIVVSARGADAHEGHETLIILAVEDVRHDAQAR